MVESEIVLLVVTFLGAFVEGITGIGFFMICMSVLISLYDYQTVMFALKLLAITQGGILVLTHRREVQWKTMAAPVLAGIPGSLIGLKLLSVLPVEFLQRALGLFLVFISVQALLIRERSGIRPTLRNGCLAGIASGFLSGTLNLPGPPLVLYYLGCLKDKNLYFATICATFLCQNIFQTAIYAAGGSISTPVFVLFLHAAPGCLTGYYLGRCVFSRVNIEKIKRWIYLIMAIMGLRSLLL